MGGSRALTDRTPRRGSRRRRGLRRATGWVTAAVVLATSIPLVAVLVTIWASGWTVTSVQTGSMEPHLPEGAAVVIEPIDPATIDVGSIVAFRDPRDERRTVIHRVRAVRDERGGRFLQTQGDANATPDRELVPIRMVEGKVRTRVVGLGTIVEWLAEPGNGALLVAAAGGALAANEAAGVRARRRRHRQASEVAELRATIDRLQAALAAARPPGAARTPTAPGSPRSPAAVLGRIGGLLRRL